MTQDTITTPGKPASWLRVVTVLIGGAILAGAGMAAGSMQRDATPAATAASAPRVTITAPAKPAVTVTIPGPPLATVTATISVERKPREKAGAKPVTLTIPGKYAVGKDIAIGQWISKLEPGDEAMTGCNWYVNNAKGELMDTNDYRISSAPQGYTGPKLSEGDAVFEFEPGCAPFELVR